MSSSYEGPTGALLGDDDPTIDNLIDATLEETPLEQAAEPDGQPEGAKEPEKTAQPNEPENDPDFAKDGVVKDPKAWQRLNVTVAELTGKEIDEVKAMPFEQRVELLKTTHQELAGKLEKLAEFEDFVGIKVDAPAEQWNPMAQIEQLPTNHQNKLIDAVFHDKLPYFTNEVLAAPQKYPEEFGLLKSAAATVVTAAYGRDVNEIDAIMNSFKGLTFQQISGLLQGNGNTYAPGGYAPVTTGQQPAAPLYDYARQLGMDLSDPTSPEAQLVQHTATMMNRMQGEFDRQINGLRTEFGTVSKRTEGFEQDQRQQRSQAAQSEIDGQATAARNGLLDQVTKGRLPEGKETRLKQLILNDAMAAVGSDQRAIAALQLAKDYKADGVEAKASGQLAIYTNRVAHHIAEAAKTVLNEVIVPGTQARQKIDQRKAAQRHLGAPAGGELTPLSAQSIANRRIRTPDEAANAAVEAYRGARGG